MFFRCGPVIVYFYKYVLELIKFFQILNFLHRGPVTFSTLVYDTNVGDISSLATYFNPERVSVKDLNSRYLFCLNLFYIVLTT